MAVLSSPRTEAILVDWDVASDATRAPPVVMGALLSLCKYVVAKLSTSGSQSQLWTR